MAKLICTGLTSLDGYFADEHGEFDWAAPDSDVLAFINDLERPIGTYLYGRRQGSWSWPATSCRPDAPGVQRQDLVLERSSAVVLHHGSERGVPRPRSNVDVREFMAGA